MNNTKPGIMTTEFWVTMITQAVGILALLGVVQPAHSTELISSLTTISGAVITIFPAIVYIKNRTWLKKSPTAPIGQ